MTNERKGEINNCQKSSNLIFVENNTTAIFSLSHTHTEHRFTTLGCLLYMHRDSDIAAAFNCFTCINFRAYNPGVAGGDALSDLFAAYTHTISPVEYNKFFSVVPNKR